MKTKTTERFIPLNGRNGMWGVESEIGSLLYEPEFTRETAIAICDMENSDNPPADWEETKRMLEVAGLPC